MGASSTDNGAANGDIALGTLEGEADKTLQDARFVIGDYIDCAVLPPLANGAVAPPPAYPGAPLRGGFGVSGGPPRSGFAAPRDNGAYGDGGFRVRGGGRGNFSSEFGRGRGNDGLPHGEWRRGERIPEGPGYGGGGGGGYGRGRGRGRGW